MTRSPSADRPRPMHGAVISALIVAVVSGAVGLPASSRAELADPTRAPFAVPRVATAGPAAAGLNPASTAMLRQAGVPAGALPSEAAAEAPARVAPPPAPAKPRHRLTSVMLGSGPGRSVAIIDGEVYRVGDKVQGTPLTAIDATGVLLGSGKGAQRLALFARQAEPPAAAPVAAKDKKGSDAAAPDVSGQPAAASAAMPPGNANAFPSLQNGARPDKDMP